MDYSEDSLLSMISEYFENTHETLLFGRGDDCALIRLPDTNKAQNFLAITTDIFAENSHFRHRYFTAQQVGHKALAVNISDVASNGAQPTAFSLALSLTGKEDEAWLRDFFTGMSKLAKAHNMALSGGDLTKADTMNITITAWGDYSHGGKPLLRQESFSGEKLQVGDIIFVLGHIGLARTALLGLEESQGSEKEFQAKYPCACAKHLEPEPLVAQGLELSMLAQKGKLCLMDISDGLARDLPRLLGSDLGANIFIDVHKLHPEVLTWATEQRVNPVEHAYMGGEDYALLGACEPELWCQIQEKFSSCKTPHKTLCKTPIWKLGTITEEKILLNGNNINACGFDHFLG